MTENRRHDRYEGKDQETKEFLRKMLVHFCYRSWMEALGYALTQLLRHGRLTPWDWQTDLAEKLDSLGWEADFSLSLEVVIVQPCFKKLRATRIDVIN